MKFDLSRWRKASPFISRETKCHLNENLPEISLFLSLLPISPRKCFHQKWLGETYCKHRELSAQCYEAAWMGEESGGEWIHVYVWLRPFALCSPEALTTLFLNQLYPSIKYKVSLFFFKGLVILGKDSHFRSSCHQVQQEFSPPPFFANTFCGF